MIRWLVWSLVGVSMEFDGGETFSHWAATRDGPGFASIVGLLLGAAVHVVSMRFNCWGFAKC